MPVKKKITKKPIKKPVKKTIKQKQSQKQSVSQRQNVVVNVHTGKPASQDKSTASKAKRVIPMPNYQPSESPYPSYVRQSAVTPVEAGNPGFASIGQTIGPIQNRIPVFADTAQQPSKMPEEETFIRPPINTNRIPKPKVRTEQPTMLPENEEDTFIRPPMPPMPEELPSQVTGKMRPIEPLIIKPTIRKTGKTRRVPKPKTKTEQPTMLPESIPFVSNIGIESESGIANIFTPVQEPAGLKSGGSFSAIFSSVKNPQTGSFKLKPPPPLPKEQTRKRPTGSRKDLEERYFMATGNRWPKVKRSEQKGDFALLKQTVEDQEAKVAR